MVGGTSNERGVRATRFEASYQIREAGTNYDGTKPVRGNARGASYFALDGYCFEGDCLRVSTVDGRWGGRWKRVLNIHRYPTFLARCLFFVPRGIPLRERHRSDASSSAPFGGGEAVSDYATRRSNPRPFNRWVIIISGTMHNLPRCTNFN